MISIIDSGEFIDAIGLDNRARWVSININRPDNGDSVRFNGLELETTKRQSIAIGTC